MLNYNKSGVVFILLPRLLSATYKVVNSLFTVLLMLLFLRTLLELILAFRA